MEHARLIIGWTIRPSTPGPDVALKALVFYPAEYRPVAGQPGQPGLRVARRGMLSIAANQAAEWNRAVANADRGAQLALREPSGRNHEITLGWRFTPADQHELYGIDGLAGLAQPAPEDLLVAWRASDSSTLVDLAAILPPT